MTSITYSKIIDKKTNLYKKLREDAIKINSSMKGSRNGSEWSKSKLSKHELMYIFQSSRGVCCNKHCKCKLDKEFTVEHIKPKSRYPHLTWELSNLTILCRSCNSRKKDRAPKHVPEFKYNYHVTPFKNSDSLKIWCNVKSVAIKKKK
jgi:5-methylcytosine-specific restriction endonuclease McrA